MAVLVSPRKRRRLRGDIDTSAVETIKSAYAALGRNDPSVLFAAMDPTINWNEAEGNPLADRNPYVGPQAVGDGVLGRLLAAIDNFTAVPSTFVDGGSHVVVLGRYGGHERRRRAPRLPVLPRVPIRGRQGRDVSAIHRHRAVDAVDEMTEA
jgi:ketosteroid isomerase-like protein